MPLCPHVCSLTSIDYRPSLKLVHSSRTKRNNGHAAPMLSRGSDLALKLQRPATSEAGILGWRRFLVRACSSAVSSSSSSAPAERCAALWQDSPAPLLMLERSIGAASGADANLWHSGRFAAEVWPDLPVAATWGSLLSKSLIGCAVAPVTI